MDESNSGRSVRQVRGLLVRAVVLFVALFVSCAIVVGWIFFHDFDQRVIGRVIDDLGTQARLLARDLQPEIAPAGTLDGIRLAERRADVGRTIGRRTAGLSIVRSVLLKAPDGRILFTFDRHGESLIPASSFGGVAPASPDAPALPQPGRKLTGLWQPSERSIEAALKDRVAIVQIDLAPGSLEQAAGAQRSAWTWRLIGAAGVGLLTFTVAFLYVLRLVHHTRRLEAASQRADQLSHLGTLASGLAHEIRNPLNAMNINMQLLEEELAGQGVGGETLSLLRSSRSEVLRLERLVKDFLAFARPPTTRREEVAPGDLVADVVFFVRPQFQGAGVDLVLVREEGSPLVLVDTGLIRQALMNVLQNALEVSPSGSNVTVTVGATLPGEARIEVRDQGPGIDEETRARLFELFWSRKPAGSGLGLPIAQRAIEVHGGRIEVENAADRGAIFRLVLPPALAASEPAGSAREDK